MRFASLKPKSLKWRMFRTIFMGTFGAGVLGVSLSVIPYALESLSDLEENTGLAISLGREVVESSITKDGSGKPYVNSDDWRLKVLKKRNPDFWYVYKLGDGSISSYNAPQEMVNYVRSEPSEGQFNGIIKVEGADVKNFTYARRTAKGFHENAYAIGGIQNLRFSFLITIPRVWMWLIAWLFFPAFFFALILSSLITRRLKISVSALREDLSSVNVDKSFQPVSDARTPKEFQPLLGSFNSTLGRLHEAYRQQRQFATELTHELRTPIAAVMAQLQLLEPSKPNQDMLKRLTQLHGFIGQLLDSDRLRWADEARTHSDLVPLVRDVAAQLAPLAAATDRTISFSVDAPSVELVTDVTAVSHVVHNLIANAIVHGAGEISISIETGKSPDQVMVTVADEGTGLTEADISVLSQEFKKGAGNGSGLGLSIASNIMRKLGGDLIGHIAEQKTAFTLALPTGKSAVQAG